MSALGLYLAMLAGSDRTGYLEQRGPGRDGRWASVYHRTDRLRPMAEQLLMVGEARDVYASAAPRSHRHGGLDAVPAVYCLWADLDGPAAVAALEDFAPAPTVVITSGSGGNRHVYWQLDRPLEADRARRALRRLAHHLSGDMACAEPARVLRPPFTTNYKGERPAPVECLELDTVAYSPAAVVGDLADPPEPRRERPAAPRSLSLADDPLLAIDPPTYFAALIGREVGRAGKTCCPFHEDRTPSLHCYATAAEGWTCFGCGAGGTIIDLGSKLYGLEPRGASYHEIRRRLEADLRARAAA